MASSLTWLDHDSAARDRSLRILALFQERESRDELGLGGIRDSLAAILFPGTSTIQTRLRYMLFVPWIYKSLEDLQISPGEFARRADTAERDLIDTMRNADSYEAGVFGGISGRQLKRLPSSVYWAGLGAWGIRAMEPDLSQDQYHRQIGEIHARRRAQNARRRERGERGDDYDQLPEAGTITWHPRLPEPPEDFPAVANFALSRDEAQFLIDRILRSHPESLLAHLAQRGEPVKVDFPWEHPDLARFSPEHRELLAHARLFSEVMHGAALVYNLTPAELRQWQAQQETHLTSLQRWLEGIDIGEISAWSLPRLWALTEGSAHRITARTRLFITQWVEALSRLGDGIIDDNSVRSLIRARETSLKKSRSRFTNQRAREQWSGASGLGRLSYRWPTASTFLHDLADGLQRERTH